MNEGAVVPDQNKKNREAAESVEFRNAFGGREQVHSAGTARRVRMRGRKSQKGGRMKAIFSKFRQANVCRLRRCVVWRGLCRELRRAGPRSRCRSCGTRLRKIGLAP